MSTFLGHTGFLRRDRFKHMVLCKVCDILLINAYFNISLNEVREFMKRYHVHFSVPEEEL